MPSSSLLRHALVLGLLSAIGPFAIDMYLPALPAIGQALQAPAAQVQLSLTVFFLALGLCQVIYGPLSDRWGRKPPLYAGMVLFVAGSIGCALADDARTLIAWRFVQGVGGCASMVIPRAIVRDLHQGAEAARLSALLMLVFSVSPILAPLAGSAIIALADWRGIFWAVAALGVLAAVLMATRLEETRPAAQRQASGPTSALAAYTTLLRDRHFLGLSFIGGFGMSSFFTYLSVSPHVLIGHHGLSPTAFSLCFAANAAALIGTAQFNARLVRRRGLARVLGLGVALHAAMAALLVLAALAGLTERLPVLLGLVFVCLGALGLVTPTVAVLALEAHGKIAGTAAALMGLLQMLTGAAVMGLLSRWVDGSSTPLVAGIGGCAAVSALLAWRTLRGAGPALHPSPQAATPPAER